ncbi:MAG: hypothetical protein ACI4KF_02155 [Huintestinicola sp.]
MLANIETLLKLQSCGNEAEIKQALSELCEINSEETDSFFASKYNDNGLFPYICCCSSSRVSDLAAQRLNELVAKIISGEADSWEMYTVINLILFKESDAMVAALRNVGENFKALSHAEMSFFDAGKCPHEFLRKRAALAYDNDCETNFIDALNDILICSVIHSKDNFGERIKKLYKDYPEAFASAGFFAYFVSDTSEAYDIFDAGNADDKTISNILSVLSGLTYSIEERAYIEYSPICFTGEDNNVWHKTVCLGESIDERWIDFLTQYVPLSAIKLNYGTDDERAAYDNYSHLLLETVNPFDASFRKYISYFARCAAKYTSLSDMRGLAVCGAIKGHELPITMAIAENICMGINGYKSIYRAFIFYKLSKRKRISILKKVEGYIREHDTDSDRILGREEFFWQVNAYKKHGIGFFAK